METELPAPQGHTPAELAASFYSICKAFYGQQAIEQMARHIEDRDTRLQSENRAQAERIEALERALRGVVATLSKDGVAHEACDAPMLDRCAATLNPTEQP